MMKVKRVFDTETERFEVGDKIRIVLQGFGDFTATAHEITDKGTLFIFDDCVCNRRMNETNTNNGGFEKSELCRWMNTELLCAFTDEIRSRMVADENGNYMTVPTYGQIFGKDWDDEWDQENVDIDQREQLPLMEKERIGLQIYKTNGHGTGCKTNSGRRPPLPMWAPLAMRATAALPALPGFARLS